MYKCEICGRTAVEHRVTLYRINPVGEVPSKWRCGDHLEDQKVDPAISEIVKVLESGRAVGAIVVPPKGEQNEKM